MKKQDIEGCHLGHLRKQPHNSPNKQRIKKNNQHKHQHWKWSLVAAPPPHDFCGCVRVCLHVNHSIFGVVPARFWHNPRILLKSSHLFTILSFPQWTRKPSQTTFTNRSPVLLIFFFFAALISNMPALYHVSCGMCRARAGLFACWWKLRAWEATSSRQMHFLSRLSAGTPNVCSSQRGNLNIPHSALLRNRNWFGSQGASSMRKVEHVECMGYFTTTLSTAVCNTPAAITVNDKIIFQVVIVHNTFLLCSCLLFVLTEIEVTISHCLGFEWLTCFFSSLFLAVDMSRVHCVKPEERPPGVCQEDARGSNETRLLLSWRAKTFYRPKHSVSDFICVGKRFGSTQTDAHKAQSICKCGMCHCVCSFCLKGWAL